MVCVTVRVGVMVTVRIFPGGGGDFVLTGLNPQPKHSNFHFVRPPVRSNGRSYKMLVMFLFFQRVISELPRSITAKLRHMIGTWLQKFGGGGHSPKKIGGQKHAKFRSILYNLRLWSRISPERLKISKIWKLIDRRQFLLHYMKKVRWTLVH